MTKPHCDQCLRSLSILLLLLACLLSLILLPWWQKMRFYDDEITKMAARVSNYESVLARKPMLEQQLKEIRERLQRNNYFLQAETPQLAAADLQQKVKQAVESNGGQLVSTQNITDPKQEKLVEVIIRIRMNGGAAVLSRVLHELESGTPLLMVDNLTIRSNKRYRGRGRSRVVEFHQDTNFDLIGFLREKGA